MLTSEDQQELIHIIENLYDFIDGGIRARRLLLARADLHQFVSRIDLSGPSDIVAQDIVDRLERKGYLSPEHPHYHALGALLSSLLKRSDLPPDQARFLASLIVRYSLVLDPAYINKLRTQYGITDKSIASPATVQMVPPRTLSSPSAEAGAQAATLVRGNARRYAELEISLFVQEAPSYRVQLRFNRPDDKGVHEPISGTATFNSQELLAKTIDPVAYGQLLTRSLFQDQTVRQEFHEVCIATEADSMDLRLRLVIDRKAHELHDVRWETLFHPIKMDSPLLTDEHILFSRFLGTRGFRPIPPFSHNPQKALLAIANPTDITHYRINNQPLAAIKVQDELDRAASCLGTINRDELFSVPASPGRVTLTHLLEKLHEGYTILYLICHGAMYTKGKLSPHLLLEKADGKAEPILVEELVKQLRGMSQLPQLVVLGSCQSAGNGMYSPGEKKMLATLGPKLAAAGIPAVVGMQGEISMDTLTRFMPTFFVEWQKDGQLDRAMAVARRTVIEQQDWWMPVLFTRLRDGCLWSTATTDNSHH